MIVDRLWLASTSPRRHQLLREAGVPFEVIAPLIDDGLLDPRAVDPRAWVMALAWLKARDVAQRLWADGVRDGLVMAADTVCAHAGGILGQPADIEAARAMLQRMRNGAHTTISGVAVLSLWDGRRLITRDATTVTMGDIGDAEIDRYLAGGTWRGKAGAYNLAERLDDGWPITCIGDPTTVMGLPMQRLPRWIRAFRSPSGAGA
jgi:septum formation protein